ncbi:MAG: hypothetical protein HZB41_00275 [Ignavibacteriae bacterium]|nr:hypothetical protein [Ignavibacteriota bacterium]
MKIYTVFLLLAFLMFVSLTNTNVEAKGKNTIKISKNTFTQGESITLKFTAVSGLKNNAWIGIIPSNVKHGSEAENDKYDLTYQYLGGKTKGTLTFIAPSKSGKYDFRMHDTDDNGLEICSVSFKVK